MNTTMKNYDLQFIQQHLLESMIEFDKICRDNNIEYWLCAGSLLGAVRHGGFIPWDDDIDVGMLRADFNKLIRVMTKVKHPFLKLQTPLLFNNRQNIDGSYLNMVCSNKLRNLRVNAKEKCDTIFTNQYQNLFIDIFVFDKIGNLNQLQISIRNLIRHLLYELKFVIKSRSDLCNTRFFKIGGQIMPKFMFNALSKASLLFANKFLSGIKKTHISLELNSSLSNVNYHLNKVFPTQDILFEGYLFRSPADYDYYLQSRYGDYLTIPKKQNIQPSHFIEVTLNEKI